MVAGGVVLLLVVVEELLIIVVLAKQSCGVLMFAFSRSSSLKRGG